MTDYILNVTSTPVLPKIMKLAPDTLPKVFQSSDTDRKRFSFDKRLAIYKKILVTCKPSEVPDYLRMYVEYSLSCGWQAYWRGTSKDIGESFNVVVQVYDCNSESFTAKVIVCEPFQCDKPNIDQSSVESCLKTHDNMVPLVELYPLYSKDREQQEAGVCTEHLRFFYKYLWRGWDEDDDEDYVYVDEVLEPRLQLYYDIKDGRIPEEIAENFFSSLEQYKQKHNELRHKQEEYGVDSPDIELTDSQFEDLKACNLELEALKTTIQMIENPTFRYLAANPEALQGQIEPKAKGPRLYGEVVTHIVINKFTAGIAKRFPDDDTVLEHHTTLDSALKSCHHGDTILLFPGHYQSDILNNMVESITIKGTGKLSDVVLESMPEQDFLLFSMADQLTMVNLTLCQLGGNDNIVAIERGHLVLDGCDIHCDSAGIQVRDDAKLDMVDCVIHDAQGAGIVLFPGSSADLKNVHIYDCGGKKYDWWPENILEGGILLQAKTDGQPDCINESPKLCLENCCIEKNQGFGITVEKENVRPELQEKENVRPELQEKENTEALKGLDVTLTGCTIKDNTKGNVGVSYYVDDKTE